MRRTDKIGTEASFHSLDEYMRGVKEFYDMYQMAKNEPVKRRVYLATDDPSVIEEAKTNYPIYEFIYDESHSKLAALDFRYSTESAEAVISDLHFLAHSDFLVCTFSSRICRLAYELMQTRYSTDASWRFRSLDDIYYFAGQQNPIKEVIYDHQPMSAISLEDNDEIELQVGDIVCKLKYIF